jgi:YggT family protein
MCRVCRRARIIPGRNDVATSEIDKRTCRKLVAQAESHSMGLSPGSILLFDAASSADRFIYIFIWVYVLLIFIYVLSTWVRLPYSPWLRRIQDFLRDVCEPYLRLFRRILPSFGPLDLSPVVAVIVLFVIQKVVHTILSNF